MRNIKKISLSLLLVIPVASFAFSAGSGTKEDPYQIRNCPELQNIIGFPNDHFLVIDNINCNLWDYGDGGGFMPIGSSASPFTGTFDGNNFKISYITINRHLQDHVGIFGVTQGVTQSAEITNVNLDNINIIGKSYVGTLVGRAKSGTKISNVNASASEVNADSSHVGGLVGRLEGASVARNTIQNASVDVTVKSSNAEVGGIVGSVVYSDISNSHTLGTVSGSTRVGGIIGRFEYSSTLSNSFAEGFVSGNSYIGGLVGGAGSSAQITNSYATGNVVATSGEAGGLLGSGNIQIENCYATGDVESLTTSQSISAGGLVGNFNGAGVIKNSYATGDVINNIGVAGGFVGWIQDSASVRNSYSVGKVSGTNSWSIGGFVGARRDSALDISSYWDTIASGQTSSVAGIPKTTGEMYQQATYVDWDFANTWEINQGFDYPRLQWEKK
ncbi:MAG: GLUG motif-containing protein [Legionellales bacterium]